MASPLKALLLAALLTSILIAIVPTFRADDTAPENEESTAPQKGESTAPQKERSTKSKPVKRSVKSTTSPKAAKTNTQDDLIPLNKKETALLDIKGKRVLVKAKVVLREGLLEMLCCLAHTKEHESILAVDAKAFIIHTGLLAIHAEHGKPVQFTPKFKPATGQRVDIFIQWRDKDGHLHRKPAQHWIRHSTYRFYVAEMKELPKDLKIPRDSDLRFDKRHHELTWYGPMSDKQRDDLLELSTDAGYRKSIKRFHQESRSRQMKDHWVFAGSMFHVDQESGKRFYMAEGGELICVANFPTATLDIQSKSSNDGTENLTYETYTERIPPLGTEVTIELIPVFKKPSKDPSNKTESSKSNVDKELKK